MNLLALVDFLLDPDRSPLSGLLRLPYHVLRACVTKMKDKQRIVKAMSGFSGDDAHTVCGSVDEYEKQKQNVTSVIKGGYIMTIEVKPLSIITGNVLIASHKTPPVFSSTTGLPMDRLQTCLNCFEFTNLTCHLVVSFFNNMAGTSIYFMEDQVIDIKFIPCTALPRVNPLLVSNDNSFKWRTIYDLTADTTRDHTVLLVEVLDGTSYILDPSFVALDPAALREKPYAIFRSDDRDIRKWYKHLEFAMCFSFNESMKLLSEHQGISSVMKKIDDELNSSLHTAFDLFNNPPSPITDKHEKKKNKKAKKTRYLKEVKREMNIEKMIAEEVEYDVKIEVEKMKIEVENMKIEVENEYLSRKLQEVVLNDASFLLDVS